MAEEQQQGGAAENKLGQLYVELKAKGLGGLVKGLNGLSAQFLLTKNAAQQFTQPLTQMVKDAGNSAVGLGKLQSILGMTAGQSQKLKAFFERNNLNEGLFNDITSLQQKFYDFSHGFAGLDENMQKAFNLMGLSVLDYNGDLESTLQLIEDIKEATQSLKPIDRAARLRDTGLNQEWGYAFDRQDFNLPEILKLTDKETENLIESEELSKQAKLTRENFWKRFAANFITPVRNTYNRGVIALADDKISKTDRMTARIGIGGGTALGALGGAAAGAALGSVIPGAGTAVGAIGGLLAGIGGGGFVGNTLSTLGIGAALNLKDKQNPDSPNLTLEEKLNAPFERKNNLPHKPIGDTGAFYNKPIDLKNWLNSQKIEIIEGRNEVLPPLPNVPAGSAVKTYSRNYNDNRVFNFNNINNITGGNAEETAHEIMNINIDEAQMQRLQYQAENNPGR